MVIALASRSFVKKKGPEMMTSEPVGLWARRGSSPFPGALFKAVYELIFSNWAQCRVILGSLKMTSARKTLKLLKSIFEGRE